MVLNLGVKGNNFKNLDLKALQNSPHENLVAMVMQLQGDLTADPSFAAAAVLGSQQQAAATVSCTAAPVQATGSGDHTVAEPDMETDGYDDDNDDDATGDRKCGGAPTKKTINKAKTGGAPPKK